MPLILNVLQSLTIVCRTLKDKDVAIDYKVVDYMDGIKCGKHYSRVSSSRKRRISGFRMDDKELNEFRFSEIKNLGESEDACNS
jgi:hypothetical protein